MKFVHGILKLNSPKLCEATFTVSIVLPKGTHLSVQNGPLIMQSIIRMQKPADVAEYWGSRYHKSYELYDLPKRPLLGNPLGKFPDLG